MNYTNNYKLPIWEESDRVLMHDFNEAMTNIDAGLTFNRAEAVQGVADAKAAAALLPYVTGSYVGTGGTQTIELGWKPSFVIISGSKSAQSGSSNVHGYFAISGGHVLTDVVVITETGFTVRAGEKEYPNIIYKDRVYDFIAFQ